MRNKLTDLNNHLFEQLERLNDEELNGDDLEQEIHRSRAITSVAKAIIHNGSLILNAKKYVDEYVVEDNGVPDVLRIDKK